MIDSYLTVKETTVHRIARQRSRFITLLSPAETTDSVQRQLDSARKSYHDASHHCYAYRLLIGHQVVEASHDDGEPSGSAGLPMLQQLIGRDVVNVLAIVIRYFGGTKLGVGGLVRAYSDAVSETLAQATVITRALRQGITIRFPVSVNSSVMSTLHRFSAHIEHLAYEKSVRVDVTIPPSQADALCAALTEASGARAKLEMNA
jgi:uncharacterized YigZ family protein